MNLRNVNTMAPLVEPLKTRPFRVSDLDIHPLTEDSLEMHIWNTWLRWIPAAGDEPLMYGDWVINRHKDRKWAEVRFKGAIDLGSIAFPPVALPFDPPPDRLYVVGFTSDWKTLLRSGGHFENAANWADAVLSVLSAWSDKYYTRSVGLRPTIWTVDGMFCALLA